MAFFIACLLLAAAAPAQPGSSQPSQPAQGSEVARPSEAEALAFVKAFSPSDLRRGTEIRILQESFVPALRKDPASAMMLEAYPELGPALTAALTAHIDLYVEEYDARFFPRAAEIVRRSLSRDVVRTLTAFYASPLGRRVLTAAAKNVDGDEVAESGIAGRDVDTGVTTRQILKAGVATFVGLSDEERRQVLAVAQSPAGRSYVRMMPEIVALQTELTNNPGPRFTAQSEKAMSDVFRRVTGVAPAPGK